MAIQCGCHEARAQARDDRAARLRRAAVEPPAALAVVTVCQIGAPKVLHATIDAAWAACWSGLAIRGVSLVPYRCAEQKKGVASLNLRPLGDGWVEVHGVVLHEMATHQPCEGYHVTRNHRHILTGGT